MISYRPADIDDADELDAMARQIWIETFEHSAPADDITAYVDGAYGPQGKLRRDLADPAHRFQLACAEGAIIGYAKLSPLWLEAPEIAPGAAQLSQLYIASAWHGRGVAPVLMQWTIDAARSRGAAALVLTVWEHNPRALRFYERWGFRHIADYAFQTGTQIDRDLIMQLAL